MSLNVETCPPLKLLVDIMVNYCDSLESKETIVFRTIEMPKDYPKETFHDFMGDVQSVVREKLANDDSVIEEEMELYGKGFFREPRDRCYLWQVVMSNKFYRLIIAVRDDTCLFVQVEQIIPIRRLHGKKVAWNVGWYFDFDLKTVGENNNKYFVYFKN